MKQENFNRLRVSEEKYLSQGNANLRKPRILVAPLDWGLGHATRCIPVIYELLHQGCEVWLATDGPQEALLTHEFPELLFLSLPGYRVKYGLAAPAMVWSILLQTPKIVRAIKNENNWLKKMVNEHDFDAVISDNRYGLYHSSIPCIIITHQLNIKSKLGKWSERLLRKMNYKYINHFTECWVPDDEGGNNLAGELSHPEKNPTIPLRYVGLLSRFENISVLPHSSSAAAGKEHLLIVLSGPEPQRTLLENIVIKDIAHYNGSATIVRGLPGVLNLIPSTNSIKFYNHLPAEELNKEMNPAEFIISRSGHSTVMDITKLHKKSILIPTPGQTEQEYLASYLRQKKMALNISQKTFSLTSALQQARSFPYSIAGKGESPLPQIIAQFIQSLQKN